MPDADATVGPAGPLGDAPWRQPARGGYPRLTHWALPGIEQLRSIVRGDVPQPPLSRLTGMRIVDVEPGSVAFQMPLTQWLCSPQGAISIGPLSMPADGAVACSIQTKLPPLTPFTTSELSLRLLAPVAPGGTVTARGRLIQMRRTIAVAEVSLTDDEGQLIGHGSTLCFIQPQITAAPPPEPEASEQLLAAGESSAGGGPHAPDPYQREPLGEILQQDVWERYSGLEILLGQIEGRLPLPPIHYLTGLSPVSASADQVTFTLPALEWLCAPPRSRVQGGGIALLAESALSSAIQARLPAGIALAPVDFKINYLRPLTSDGRLAVGRGQVIHAGRRIAVANAEVHDADGRPVAVATGSAMLLPGRPASLAAAGSP